MLDRDNTLSFAELVERTGESERTLRYYVHLGLLAGPAEKGPAARYPASHVERVAWIRAQQALGVPLRQVAQELHKMDRAGQLPLGLTDELDVAPGAQAPMTRGAGLQYLLSAGLLDAGKTPRGTSWPKADPGQWEPERTRWERLVLADGIELHVRRPLDTWTQRKVERLLKQAGAIFGPGSADAESGS